jgi:excisionase family DNA binding protein
MKNLLLEKIEEMMNASEAIEKPLTFEEAREFLNVSKSTLYKMTFSKKIPHSKPGGKRIYFRKSDLVEWMLKNPVRSHYQIENAACNHVVLNKT